MRGGAGYIGAGVHAVRIQRVSGYGGGILHGFRPGTENHRSGGKGVRPARIARAASTRPARNRYLDGDAGRKRDGTVQRPSGNGGYQRRRGQLRATDVHRQPAVRYGGVYTERFHRGLRVYGGGAGVRTGYGDSVCRPAAGVRAQKERTRQHRQSVGGFQSGLSVFTGSGVCRQPAEVRRALYPYIAELCATPVQL